MWTAVQAMSAMTGMMQQLSAVDAQHAVFVKDKYEEINKVADKWFKRVAVSPARATVLLAAR